MQNLIFKIVVVTMQVSLYILSVFYLYLGIKGCLMVEPRATLKDFYDGGCYLGFSMLVLMVPALMKEYIDT